MQGPLLGPPKPSHNPRTNVARLLTADVLGTVVGASEAEAAQLQKRLAPLSLLANVLASALVCLAMLLLGSLGPSSSGEGQVGVGDSAT